MRTSWDELQLVLTVARRQGLSGAAQALGVDHSTVYRRLGALEARLGASLFERRAGGYAPTPLGAQLLAAAERMAQEAEALELRLASGGTQLSGTVRLTAPDDVAEVLLLPLLAAFRATHGRVTVELAIDNRRLDLSRREADIAVRPTSRPPPSLVGRRIGRLTHAVYGLPDLAGRPHEQLDWICWEEDAPPPLQQDWFAARPTLRPGLRIASMAGQAAAAEAGLGAALLPCFLGDRRPGLQRLSPPLADSATDLWLLCHAEARRRPATGLLLDALYRGLRAARPRLDPGP